jgi:hypothetical protein
MALLPPLSAWDVYPSNTNATATTVMQRNGIGILPQPVSSWDSNSVAINSYDYVIQGRMFLASDYVPYDFTGDIVGDIDSLSKEKEDEVKYRLTEKLLRAMIEGKCVEFTKSIDHASGSHTYRARCFVTPNDQVKILRTQGIK